MSVKLQPARGTKDILFDEYRLFAHIVATARRVASCYGFEEISTPIFEFTEVFKRTLGDESDIVSKEMYSFEDRGGENITLRPEFTAGIARAFISEGLAQQVPVKCFTAGPLFRYERPQKGRQRQFHQINFEILGAPEPEADIEVISLGWAIVQALGLGDKITLEINSLADKDSRDKYRNALVEYLQGYRMQLSEDSQRRLDKNPLRILDSKDDGDKKILIGSPVIRDYYSNESAEFYGRVKEGLEQLGIRYKENPALVRGLDYYCHTSFEFTTALLGAQNAVLAGGRYDGLIQAMGGPHTPAIGFAGGMERLMALIGAPPVRERAIVLVPIGEKAEREAVVLAYTLRGEGFMIDMAYSGNVGKRMKKAGKNNACAAVIFGDSEMASEQVKVKDFDSGQEKAVDNNKLVDYLRQYNARG